MNDLSLPQLPALRRSTLVAALGHYAFRAFIGAFVVPSVLFAALFSVSCDFSFDGVALASVQQVAQAGTGEPNFIVERHCAEHEIASPGTPRPVQCKSWISTRISVPDAARSLASTLRGVWTTVAVLGVLLAFVYARSSPLALRRRIDLWAQTKLPRRFSRKGE